MADDLRVAYLEATILTPEREQRLLAELEVRRERRPRWPLVTAASAAAAAIAVGLWWTRSDAPATLPLDHVNLVMDGVGTVRGTRRAPEIAWETGTLRVEVEPDRGVHLAVITPEGRAEVVGTAFTVSRAHHGTQVSVSHGEVQVICTGEPGRPVGADQHHICLPADAPTLLLRLAELTGAGAPADERLISADRGLSLGPDPTVRAELLAHRVRALTDGGRTAEALASADAYLASGAEPRRAAMISFVARTRYARESCGAVPALERAVAELPPGPERLLLAACVAEGDPARARALCDGAEAWASGEWLAFARDLRARIGR